MALEFMLLKLPGLDQILDELVDDIARFEVIPAVLRRLTSYSGM